MMGRTQRWGTIAVAAVVLAATAGCTRIRDHKGYIADTVLVDSIQPGIDNRDSVAKTLGRPTFSGQFSDDTWYYVSRETRQLAFSEPKAKEQTIVAVRFDAAGNVVGVEKAGKEQIASIDPAGDKTPTLGRERGFLGELFGNIGRVGAMGQGGGTADNPN